MRGARGRARTVMGMFRRLTTTQLVVDILIAVGYFLVFFIAYFRNGQWEVVISAGFALALALRRKAPGLALGIAWVVAVFQMVMGVDPNPMDVAVFPIVYAAAAYGSSLTRWISLASSLVAPVTITVYILATQGWSQLGMCLQFQYDYCATYVLSLIHI